MRHKSRVRACGSSPSGAVGQRLRRLTEWAVLGCVTAAVGCGEESLQGLHQALEGADGPWHTLVCPDVILAADPIQPAQPVDYLAVYSRGTTDGAMPSLISDYGNPCQSAKDSAACVASLTQHVTQGLLADPSLIVRPVFMLTNSGDAVERIDDVASLARVLGPIDTESEALLIAELAGLRHACGSLSFGTTLGTQIQTTPTGYRLNSTWEECGTSNGKQQIEVYRSGAAGAFTLNQIERSGCSVGRRPEGLALSSVEAGCELASLLVQTAQLEAASVPAFVRLARELAQLGAPALSQRARRSARDEVRHTRLMQLLAARYHGAPSRPQVQQPARSRGAADVARDNAVEGCVRETFGALIAWQQAATARDPVVARVMRAIAADETRHAQLSWDVAGWLEPQLPARDRAAVAAARSSALSQLSAEIAADPLPEDAREQIGWPSASRQQALLQHMAGALALS